MSEEKGTPIRKSWVTDEICLEWLRRLYRTKFIRALCESKFDSRNVALVLVPHDAAGVTLATVDEFVRRAIANGPQLLCA